MAMGQRGSVFATLTWFVASFLFSWYLASFANYNATYGSLGAVVGLMIWLWISTIVVLLGAELNAEMEHQTARDLTVRRGEAPWRAWCGHGRYRRSEASVGTGTRERFLLSPSWSLTAGVFYAAPDHSMSTAVRSIRAVGSY